MWGVTETLWLLLRDTLCFPGGEAEPLRNLSWPLLSGAACPPLTSLGRNARVGLDPASLLRDPVSGRVECDAATRQRGLGPAARPAPTCRLWPPGRWDPGRHGPECGGPSAGGRASWKLPDPEITALERHKPSPGEHGPSGGTEGPGPGRASGLPRRPPTKAGLQPGVGARPPAGARSACRGLMRPRQGTFSTLLAQGALKQPQKRAEASGTDAAATQGNKELGRCGSGRRPPAAPATKGHGSGSRAGTAS